MSATTTSTTTSALAPGLARKVKKILEIKTESPDLVAALGTLSAAPYDNTPAARRQLRATVERRGLALHAQFLAAAEAATAALDGVQGQLDGLSASCGAITGALASARATAAGLLADADKAKRELAAVEAKRGLAARFLQDYQLTGDEVSALQGGRVGPEFFAALARAREIHERCRGLLRSHHQRAGLELMDQMAAHQEGAYEHLCRWVQAECRALGEAGDGDAPDVDATLAGAVAALRGRPALFRYCVDEVAGARHDALFQRFLVALTRGGPGGLPRPIEIHAHDPRRYVADMLAWLHQALCSEREFVAALFGDAGDGDAAAADGDGEGDGGGGAAAAAGGGGAAANGAAAASAAGAADVPSARQLLDRIFASVCRPLRVRVEQVLMMSPPLLLCYHLAQLAGFYHGLVSAVLGPDAALSQAVAACRDTARRGFTERLAAAGERLLRAPPPPPPDLGPPAPVAQALQLLAEILAAHEGSLQAAPPSSPPAGGGGVGGAAADGGGNGGDGGQQEAIDGVLAALVDPLLEAVARSAEALSPDSPARLDDGAALDPAAHRCYLINCFAAVHAALAARPAGARRAAAVQGLLEGHVEALVGQEAARVLGASGLAEVAERVLLYRSAAETAAGSDHGEAAPPPPPASDPALSLSAVVNALRRFFVAVSSPDALPEFAAIQSPRLRGEAVARVAARLLASYEAVYGLLDDEAAGYAAQGGSAAAKHTPAQVRTILGVL